MTEQFYNNIVDNVVHVGQLNVVHAGQLNVVHAGQLNVVHAGPATSTLSKPVNRSQTCCAFLRMYIKMIIEMENSTTHSRSRVWFCYMPHGMVRK